MKNLALVLASVLAVSQSAAAVVNEWGQCGGIGYTGDTVCASGLVCTKLNDYYYQCLKGSTSSSTRASSSTVRPSSSSTRSSSTVSSAVPSTTKGLNTLAKAKGKLYFGTAVDTNELADAAYAAIMKDTNEFGQITPGNAQKWDATEGTRNVFTFTRADNIVNWAIANGQRVRGHTLVWHSQLPSWVSNGNFDNATLVSILENHVTNVVTHFKGRVETWDVVNEVFNEDGTWRDSVFYRTIGEYFVDIAFRAARRADPNALLAINDYNIDGTGAKSTATYNLVQRMKARGTPVDQIGIQAHLVSGGVPTTLQTNWAQFASLGVTVAITELDIRIKTPSDATKLAQQAADYKRVVQACVAVPKCIGITVWAFSDKYSWIPSVFPTEGAALPWDENFQKKPAYYAIAEALA